MKEDPLQAVERLLGDMCILAKAVEDIAGTVSGSRINVLDAEIAAISARVELDEVLDAIEGLVGRPDRKIGEGR